MDFVKSLDGILQQNLGRHCDLVLLEVDDASPVSRPDKLSEQIKEQTSLPVIALVSQNTLGRLDHSASLDDFIVIPCDVRELHLRISRLLQPSESQDEGELITCGRLAVNLAKCEVTLAGETIPLTYREYELLRFLMSYRGRVFNREELLNRVWGYDYYGGDRTVDVHIRRLRSKLDNPHQVFIETVRSIGYRFREDD